MCTNRLTNVNFFSKDGSNTNFYFCFAYKSTVCDRGSLIRLSFVKLICKKYQKKKMGQNM